jgi:hypothetical protein
MKRLFLTLGLYSLLFCVACGTSGVTGFIPHGPFSNASLKGQYVYQLSGSQTDSITGIPVAYYESGVFNADGNGNLTNVTDDFEEGGGPANTVGTGTYNLSSSGDGTGNLIFNNALGSVTVAVTMVTTSKVYLIEADPLLNSSGIAELQSSTALPVGTFAFRKHNVDPSGNQSFSRSSGTVGVIKVAGDGTVTGNEDVDLGNVISSPTITSGTLGSLDSTTGRGNGSFTDSSPLTSTFFFYVVDANNIRFLFFDPAPVPSIGIGRAEMQSAPALSGNYAFGGRGDTPLTSNPASGTNGVNTVGAFTASGGAITAGAIDSVEDGASFSNQAITTGNYSLAASGRATVTLTTSGTFGTLQATVWMVSPARGFFLVTNDATAVQDGTLDLQLGTFSNATMNGQFAFMMDGFDATPQLLDRLGTLQWDGTSKLVLNEVANSSANGSGAQSPGVLSGSYSVTSNGRAVGKIGGLSSNLVFYLISGSDAYVLQNDTGVEINGMISLQPK